MLSTMLTDKWHCVNTKDVYIDSYGSMIYNQIRESLILTPSALLLICSTIELEDISNSVKGFGMRVS